jgi:hypothetical protein
MFSTLPHVDSENLHHSHPWKAREFERQMRRGRSNFVEFRQSSCVNHFGDLFGEIVADSREFRKILTLQQHIADFVSGAAQRASRIAVGANPEWIVVLQLENVRDFVKRASDVFVVREDRSHFLSGRLPCFRTRSRRRIFLVMPSGHCFSRPFSRLRS